MPELPEVQVVVNDLIAAGVVGHKITRIKVNWPASISGSDVTTFRLRVTGRTIVAIRRRGKYILFELEDTSTMAVHLRMSGRFVLMKGPGRPPRHVQVEMVFDDHRRLWFHDTRKFGRFYHALDLQSICGHLGVEPLAPNFSRKVLASLLLKRHRQIKPLLLDQTIVAGLGNIYVDEALWSAGIHPLRGSHTLTLEEIRRLHSAIHRVLRQGIKHSGTSLGDGLNNFTSIGVTPINSGRGSNASHLKVFRRTGQPCPRCRSKIQRIKVAQRSTHICPLCQQ
jgi:formamidopyrimidine-DNA glycosylase